jgi:hypothetical protein
MDKLKLTLGMTICSYYLSPEPEFGKRLAQTQASRQQPCRRCAASWAEHQKGLGQTAYVTDAELISQGTPARACYHCSTVFAADASRCPHCGLEQVDGKPETAEQPDDSQHAA